MSLSRFVGVLFLASTACLDAGDPARTSPSSLSAVEAGREPAPQRSAARYEVRFMTDMIDHHHMAVMMGELCLDRAVHEELRAMCEQIIAVQTAEIEQMQSWLADWYGVEHEPVMTAGMEQRMQRLASTSGAEFEIMFLESMIRHHAGAVREGEHCVERAYHEALIELCHGIVESQTAEIEQMEAWLCEWYGDCN